MTKAITSRVAIRARIAEWQRQHDTTDDTSNHFKPFRLLVRQSTCRPRSVVPDRLIVRPAWAGASFGWR
jgi:hypothetical protein